MESSCGTSGWNGSSCGVGAARTQGGEEGGELVPLPREVERGGIGDGDKPRPGGEPRDGRELEPGENDSGCERGDGRRGEDARERGPVLQAPDGRAREARDAREREDPLAVDRGDASERGAL